MRIIDAQGHLNMLGPIDLALVAMDAVGVEATFFDEADGHDAQGREIPGREVAPGIWRPECPNALAAARAHPDRIGLMRRIHYLDPDIDALLDQLAGGPFRAMARVTIIGDQQIADALDGALDPLCAATQAGGLPLVLLSPGRADVIARQAALFPDLRIVIDHCGLPMPRIAPPQHDSPSGYRAPPRPTGTDLAGPDTFTPVFDLARNPNVLLKWSHAPYFASAGHYPFDDVMPLLRGAIDAFGADRILWASDFTVVRPHYTLAEALFYIRDASALSPTEKASILGGTVAALTSPRPAGG